MTVDVSVEWGSVHIGEGGREVIVNVSVESGVSVYMGDM